MSAFKAYVIREVTDSGAVFERTVMMALKEELDAERAGSPPDLSKVLDDDELVRMIKSNSWFHRDLTERAIAGKGVFTLEEAKQLQASPITNAGKRGYTPPRRGTLKRPALLNENPAPDTAAICSALMQPLQPQKPKFFEIIKNWFKF